MKTSIDINNSCYIPKINNIPISNSRIPIGEINYLGKKQDSKILAEILLEEEVRKYKEGKIKFNKYNKWSKILFWI